MANFAAPNMTAVGTVGAGMGWNTGQLPITLGGAQSFTLEMWFKLRAGVSATTLFTQPGGLGLFIDHGHLKVSWSDGSSFAGVTSLTPDVWYHAAVVYDKPTLTIYLDGASENHGSASPGTPSAVPAIIGSIGSQFDGLADVWSVTLYNYAISAKQAGEAPWLTDFFNPRPLRHFDFSVAPPQEPIANVPAVPFGGALSQTIAPAVQFDGQNAGVLLPSEELGRQYTVSAWVAVTGSLGSVFSTDGPFTYFPGVQLALSPDGWWAYSNGQNSGTVTFPTPVATNDWHNYVLTCDGTAVTLYLDGAVVGTFQTGTQYGPSEWLHWELGYSYNNFQAKDYWFDGFVQWFSAWPRCLSAAEVVFQQYGSVAEDPTILMDVAMDIDPVTDLVREVPVALGGTAVIAEQRVTVTNWSPPPAQLHPPVPPTRSTRLEGPVRWHTPVLPIPHQTAFDDAMFEHGLWLARRNFANLPPALAATRHAAFAEASRQAYREALTASHPCFWRREGEDLVFVVRHMIDGDVETLRVKAVDISTCQMWWMTFMTTLLSGVANLFFITFRAQDLTEWIQRRVLNNQTVMEAFVDSWRAQPGFTGFLVVKFLGVLSALGLLKSFLYFVAYQAGYGLLTKIIVFLITNVFSGGTGFALFASRAATLAVQLGFQYFGAPNTPGYNACCGSAASPATASPTVPRSGQKAR